MSNIKIGLIGGGYWGKNLIREFNNTQTLHTICDINIDALSKYNELYPNINTTTDWNLILKNPEINAVCIALPAHLHYTFAKNALLAGKDVYVEKPITLHLEEAEELVKIANTQNKILMVGHLLHYHPCIEKIKEIIKANTIGRVKNIVANRLNLGIFRTNENVLWSFAPHDISVILNLCDDNLPNSVICQGKDHITNGIHDVTNSILKYSDKYVNINVNWLNPYKEQKMSIIGEKGMILFDDTSPNNKITLFPEYIKFQNVLNTKPTPIKNNGINIQVDLSKSPLLKECEHFVDCCKNRTKPITDGEEGVRVLKTLSCLQQSLLQNKEIFCKKPQKHYFVHPTATVDEGAIIGEGTKIWHYSHICKGAVIGKDCNIGQNVFIAGGAKIGNNCKVQNNVSIYAGVEADDFVFFGPSCVLTNDINPRGMFSKGGKYIKTVIHKGATLGANCTIVCGNTLGKHCLIGSGAVVCKDVNPFSIIVGNPGKKIGVIDEKGHREIFKK